MEAYATKVAQAIRSRLDRKPVDDVLGVPVTFHRKAKLYVATPAEVAAPAPAKKAGLLTRAHYFLVHVGHRRP